MTNTMPQPYAVPGYSNKATRHTPWGIFLLGPLDGTYCMVRAACYVSARTLANTEIGGGWDSAPAEIVGDALVDAFPRILMKTKKKTKPNLVPVEQRGTGGADGWLFTYLGWGIRRAKYGDYNVETLDRRFWLGTSLGKVPYCDPENHTNKDNCGIFETYDEAHAMLMRIAERND